MQWFKIVSLRDLLTWRRLAAHRNAASTAGNRHNGDRGNGNAAM
jgi:hypothetical protein